MWLLRSKDTKSMASTSEWLSDAAEFHAGVPLRATRWSSTPLSQATKPSSYRTFKVNVARPFSIAAVVDERHADIAGCVLLIHRALHVDLKVILVALASLETDAADAHLPCCRDE